MRSLRPVLSCLMLSGLVLPSVALAAGAPAMDSLLPKTTVGFVTATNYPNLADQWNKTQVGKLLTEPVMKPFEDDLQAQLQAQWSALVADRLGIHLNELDGVPTGEASLSLIEPQPGAVANVLLLDVTNNANKAEKLLKTAIAGLVGRGARQLNLAVHGVTVYAFAVPPPAGQQAAAAANGAAGKGPAAPAQFTIYFLTDNFFCACDDLDVTKDIIGRLTAGNAAGSLSEVASYQMVMKRCAADTPSHTPGARWFMYPLGYAEATRAGTPTEKRRRGKTIIEIMRNQGYGALQGIGGYVDISTDGYQILHRTAIYAPHPWIESMKMFVFPTGSDFTPQPWVSRDVATYSTAYFDILNAFDNFGPLYDEIVDAKGVWKQTIEQMKTDPGGPQIDLRAELIKHLGPRVTMVTEYNLPITTTSERLLWAIEAKDPAAVAKAVEKCVNNDSTIKKRSIDGHDIWEIVEEEESAMPQLKVDVPQLGPSKGNKPKSEDSDDQDKEQHFLPHGAFTVAHGQLFIASHIDYLKKVLKPIPADKQLATDPAFLKVWNLTFNELGVKQQTARSFSWTDRAVQPTYEMIRQGKMPQSESLLGRTLNSLSAAGKKGEMRKQRINGSKLPDFAFVAKALGPATASMTSEPNGWFVKGVLVTK